MGGAHINVNGRGREWEFPLAGYPVCRIGRSERNTLVLRGDAKVSRYHAVIQLMEPGEYWISDVGSINGTALNGRLILAPAPLRNGDVLKLGGYELIFTQQERVNEPEPDTLGEGTTVGQGSRLVTVLVIDLRDSTGWARRLGSERFASLLSDFTLAAGLVLARNACYVHKFIGDAVMALWLHAGDRPRGDELRAVFRAAGELIELVGQLQPRHALDAPVRCGVGISSGLAAVRNMGGSDAADHTALGACVTKAFRLEAATVTLRREIAVGAGTHSYLDAVPELLRLLQAAPVQLKGFSETELAYPVTAAAVRAALAGSENLS
jgi:adenylate cyclase